MKQAIFFDLDGTLTDSGPGIMNCAQPALAHFGIDVPDRTALRAFVGPPLRQSFGRFGVPEADVDEAIRIFRQRYHTVGKFENVPYPGIPDLLKQLQEEGYPLFVATSKPEILAKEILAHFELDQYFTLICGASLDSSRETKAEVLSYLLTQTDPAGAIVMVGDTDYDVLGAAEHHIPAIGVSWGYGDVDSMKKAGAVSMADTPQELYALLTEKK